jgi:hypothetical protein
MAFPFTDGIRGVDGWRLDLMAHPSWLDFLFDDSKVAVL